jgi:hypothetical protein
VLQGESTAEIAERLVVSCGVKKFGSAVQPLICCAKAERPKIVEPPE